MPDTYDVMPANKAYSVTGDDDNDLTNGACRAIYVGGAGNINCDLVGGTTVVFSGLLAGVVYPLSVKRVRSTSTTATNIVALY